MTLSDLADEIYTELGEPDDISQASIVYWLKTNVGQVNNLLDTSFESDDTTITPSPSDQEKVIFKILYSIYYYTKQVNKNLGAAAYVSVMEIKEGNRTIKRANKNDVAKNYMSMVQDYRTQLQDQVVTYKINQSSIQQQIVDNPITTELPEQIETSVRGFIQTRRRY